MTFYKPKMDVCEYRFPSKIRHFPSETFGKTFFLIHILMNFHEIYRFFVSKNDTLQAKLGCVWVQFSKRNTPFFSKTLRKMFFLFKFWGFFMKFCTFFSWKQSLLPGKKPEIFLSDMWISDLAIARISGYTVSGGPMMVFLESSGSKSKKRSPIFFSYLVCVRRYRVL